MLPPSYLGPKRLTKSPLKPERAVVPTAAVAIKIKHPKVDQLIGRDLAIMSFFAHAITLFPGMQWLSLPEEVDVFGRIMQEQLNLALEADNLLRFERNFAGRREPVTFPRALREWSTHEVLVEEFQHALPLESFLRNGGGPFEDELAEVGLDAFLNMLLLDNFVHSDLHPGNIMVKFGKPSTRLLLRNVLAVAFGNESPHEDTYSTQDSDRIVDELRAVEMDPVAWREKLNELSAQGYMPEVVFIDAGLVTELNETNRANFLELFRAIAEFDGYRAGHLMVERSRSPELAVEPETFALKIQHMVLNVKRKTFSLGQIKISDVLAGVLQAIREHHVKMEGDFINTVISILLLEGIGRQLDPDLDLFASSLPILRQLGRQMSTQDSFSQMKTRDIASMFKVRAISRSIYVNCANTFSDLGVPGSPRPCQRRFRELRRDDPI
jgi:aarF domain-containing kinase